MTEAAIYSAKELGRRIDAFVAAHNAKSHPFTWTATADEILAKVARTISGTQH